MASIPRPGHWSHRALPHSIMVQCEDPAGPGNPERSPTEDHVTPHASPKWHQWGRDVAWVSPALAIYSILQIKPAWNVNISCPRDKEASQAGRFVTLCLAEKLQSTIADF